MSAFIFAPWPANMVIWQTIKWVIFMRMLNAVLKGLLTTVVSAQVPVIQVLLGQFGLVTSTQMFSQWKFVVVGATVAAAVLTPSTDPFTQVGMRCLRVLRHLASSLELASACDLMLSMLSLLIICPP